MAHAQRFDLEAATWDDNPRRVRLAKAVADAIIRRLPLTRAMDVLDFGCGTGLLTLNLLPHIRSITGADTSSEMLEMLRKKVEVHGLHHVDTLLLEPHEPLVPRKRYDLITSSMTLHHIQDLEALFHQFQACLGPGGRIALADLDKEDGTFHENVEDVHHLGFERNELLALLGHAGFEDLEATTAFEVRRNGRDYPVFLIVGRRRH